MILRRKKHERWVNKNGDYNIIEYIQIYLLYYVVWLIVPQHRGITLTITYSFFKNRDFVLCKIYVLWNFEVVRNSITHFAFNKIFRWRNVISVKDFLSCVEEGFKRLKNINSTRKWNILSLVTKFRIPRIVLHRSYGTICIAFRVFRLPRITISLNVNKIIQGKLWSHQL